MIALQGISKVFGGRSGALPVRALDGIDLKVASGEVFGIIGPSGAGKSTLVRVVNLLERPSAGRVLVEGVEITGLSGARLRAARRGIGMIFQHFNLLSSRTAFGNVALPLELVGTPAAEIRRKVGDLLDLVGAVNQFERFCRVLPSGRHPRRRGLCRRKSMSSG